MRTFLMLSVVAVCASALVVPGAAAEKTVSGLLVEAGCGSHLGDTNPSDEHVACMVRCAQNGDPVGILTDDGLYTIAGDWVANNGDKRSELMAEQVEATGETSQNGGQLVIDVSTIELAPRHSLT